MSDYAKGFKDGFAAGLEEGKKLVSRDTVFQPGILGLPNTCQVCGRLQDGVTGYVCYSPKCPSKVTCGTNINGRTTAMTGAVGSELRPEDYHPDWIGNWSEKQDRGR